VKFRTGQEIQQSGIYKVTHEEHRLPHEVTLIRNEIFPPCCKCKNEVLFELLRSVNVDWGRIVLNELPVLIDKKDLEEENGQAC